MKENEKKILVVEDVPSFREIISDLIECEGFSVLEASDGREAQQIIEKGGIELVVTDIQMPNMTGVELIKWIRQSHDFSVIQKNPLPIVLMTGFAHLIETQEAHSLGVEAFLTKPFTGEELISEIHSIFSLPQGKAASGSQAAGFDEYLQVALGEFSSGEELKADVFVKLSEKKMLKIARQGDSLCPDRLDRYIQKGLTHLFVQKA